MEGSVGRKGLLSEFVGVAYSIVGEGGVEEMDCAGVCYIDGEESITKSTMFLTASISKLFTATAILQLHEVHKLDIDTDINIYLPFTIKNPKEEGYITARQLLEHSSGLSDDEEGLKHWRYDSFSPRSLIDHIKDHIVPGGSSYKDALWSAGPRKYRYSNAGFTLLGLLIEQVSGKTFCEYMQNHILDPLGMESSTWEAPEGKGVCAVPHSPSPLGNYCVAEYPACQLRSSIKDLSSFLHFFITGKSTATGKHILHPDTLRLMCPPDYYHGLGWWGKDAQYGYYQNVWIHGGFMDGVRTQINFYPEWKKGFIILTNGEQPYSLLEKSLLQSIRWGSK